MNAIIFFSRIRLIKILLLLETLSIIVIKYNDNKIIIKLLQKSFDNKVHFVQFC